MPFTIIAIIVGVILLITLLTIIGAGFVSASPGEIKVISGPRGQRVLHGKTGWKIPLLERVDSMTAGMISVDVKTSDYVPTNDYINIKVDAAVKVKIGTENPVLFQAATRNFLYKTSDEIADEIRDTLEGHLRSIIGQMELSTIVTDRSKFAETVQNNAKQDLEEMGLEIVAFNIQGLNDNNHVIENLGIDNTEKIRKEAAKAKSIAQQEIAQQQAESDKLANDARVKADLEIAQKQTDLEKTKASLKSEIDTERAKADAAYAIQQEIQRKEIELQSAEANIVKEEKQAEVKEREVEVRKQTLAAEIKAEADAQKYARQQAAEAEKLERQNKAEAELFETQKEAEAKRAIAEANKFAQLQEAEAIQAKGEAEAKAIELKLLAEAEGLDKKAEAMKKYGEAAITEMLVKALPEIAKAVATPLSNVDSITMYGSDNSAKMVGDIMTTMDQVTKGMGLDVKDLITATLTGRKIGEAIAETAIDVTPVDKD
jgi:conserved surface-anchored protein, band 7 family